MSNLEQFYKFISAHAEKTSNDRILCEICNEVIKRKYIPDHNSKCEKRKRFTPASQPIISPQVKSLFGGKPIITEVKKPALKPETKSRPEIESRPEPRASTASESRPKVETKSRASTASESRPEPRAFESKPETKYRASTASESRPTTKAGAEPRASTETGLVNKKYNSETRVVARPVNNLALKKSEDIWIKENDIINNISDGSSDEYVSVLTEYNGNMEWSDTSSDELDTILTITESMGKIKNSYNRLNVPAKPIKLLPAEFKIKYSAMDRDRKHKLKKLYKFFQTCGEESKSIPKQFIKFNMPEDKKYVKKLIKVDEEELSSKIDSMLNKYSSVL